MRYPIKLKCPTESGEIEIQLLDFGRSISIHTLDTDQALDEARRCIEELVIESVNRNVSIPIPRSIRYWQTEKKEPNAIWSLIDIHPDFFSDEMERINVSISKRVLARLDTQARKMGKTRSAAIVQMALTYESDSLYDVWVRSAL